MLITSNKNKKNIFFSFFISLITFAVSYYYSLYYVEGDQFHYAKFYIDIRDLDIYSAFKLYRSSLGSQEPVYFAIVYFVTDFIEKNIFMSLTNGILMFYVSELLISKRVNKFFILTLVFNFYFLVLFLAAERLKFSLLFLILYFYYYQNKTSRITFLILSVLSHTQTLLLLISAYINTFFKTVSDIFIKKEIKKISFIIVIIIFTLFVFSFLKDHTISKIEAYWRGEANIFDTTKPIIFMVFVFLLYKKEFLKIFLMFFPLIIGSYVFGESRIVVFAYFLFLFLSFKKSYKVNTYLILTSIYFTYQGFGFLNKIMLNGHGF